MEIQQTASNKRSGVGGGNGVTGGRSILAAAAIRRRKLEVETDTDLENRYPDILNFYTEPPSYSISLEEFDRYAVERLKMLRLIERHNQESKVRYSSEYFYALKQSIKPDELPTYNTMFSTKSIKDQDPEEQLNARKIDHISHFLLRLAFARTDEQRKWFISLEMDFFRLKLDTIKNLNRVLAKYNLPYEEVSTEVKNKYATEIGDATFTVAPISVRSDTFQVFKVHFTHALELVRNRNVFLHRGYAFVPYHELSGVISVKFRSYLSESMSILKKNIHLVEDDERLRPLVIGFEKRHLGSDASVKSGDAVSAAQLSTFSQKSFPLCMKHLYDVVQKDHHLKHWGRLQLGLFFKALGLPLDEAIKFWRTNFTQRPEIDAGRFDKQYLYNIRHMYGQEGKRTDYTPYSCMKIIHSSVGPGDHHGCPFRHSDATPLRVKLVDAGISQDGIKEIMNLVEQKHYQIACQKYFEWTHDKLTIDGGVNHPNQYFNESRDILTGKKTIKLEGKAETKTKRTVYYSDGQRSQPEQSGEQMDVIEVNENEMDDDHEGDAMIADLELMEH